MNQRLNHHCGDSRRSFRVAIFLTHQKASVEAGLALLAVWLLEASWRATGAVARENGHGLDRLWPEAFYAGLKRLWWRGVLIGVLIGEPDAGWATPPH